MKDAAREAAVRTARGCVGNTAARECEAPTLTAFVSGSAGGTAAFRRSGDRRARAFFSGQSARTTLLIARGVAAEPIYALPSRAVRTRRATRTLREGCGAIAGRARALEGYGVAVSESAIPMGLIQ